MNKQFIFMLVVVLISALLVVTVRHENRLSFIALQKAENQRTHLQFEWGRLMLEKATWAMENNIADDASNRLGMLTPSSAKIITVQVEGEKLNNMLNKNTDPKGEGKHGG